MSSFDSESYSRKEAILQEQHEAEARVYADQPEEGPTSMDKLSQKNLERMSDRFISSEFNRQDDKLMEIVCRAHQAGVKRFGDLKGKKLDVVLAPADATTDEVTYFRKALEDFDIIMP